MKDTDLAYAAGLIDGEGCIYINKRSWKLRPSIYYFTEITVVNTNENVIIWLRDNFGGYATIRKSSDERHKDIYAWRLSNRAACNFLRSILPFMIIKPEQARVAIELESNKSTTSKLTKEQVAHKEQCYQALRKLNRRGKIPITAAS